MLPDEFREELGRTREAFRGAGVQNVAGFRSSRGWMGPEDLWALDILADEGFTYDSSINPVLRQYAGQRFRFGIHEHRSASGRGIREFPIATIGLAGTRIGIAGGNWVRQFPHTLLKRLVEFRRRKSREPLVFYFMPWELDRGQPHLSGLSRTTRLRHYRNLGKTRWVFERYLRQGMPLHVDRGAPRPAPASQDRGRGARGRSRLPSRSPRGGTVRGTGSLVVPLYNEEENVGYLQRTMIDLRQRLAGRYDVHLVLVDDGSKDETWRKMQEKFGPLPECTLVRQPRNMGVAAAILAGIERAPTEIVCSIDCDCSYDPYELAAMIPLIDAADLVTASPYHPAGHVLNVPPWRLFLSKTLSRNVQMLIVPAADFAAGVTVTEPQVAARYEERKADYQTPESVNLQYVQLSLPDVAAGVQVTEEGLHGFYDQVAAERYASAERRRARHILIEAGTDDAAAKAKAEKLAEEARGGADFAALASQNSDDPGSKGQGGDLGWATRDSFVAPFAEALFAMNTGEVRGPVKTQFGYHIIKLEAVEAATQRPFEEVRTELEADYRREQAQSAFYERSQELADESFAALSELESVAKKLGLELRTVEGFSRKGGGALGADRKVIDAAFSDDVLQERQNSPAISVGEESVVVLRVTDHKPPAQRTLDEVRAEIESSLRAEAAGKAAEAAAGAAAAKLAAGAPLADVAKELNAQPSGVMTVARNTEALPPELLKSVFSVAAPAAGTTAAGAATLANGNAAAFVINAVRPGTMPTVDAAQMAEFVQQAAGQTAITEFMAYVAELERNAKVVRSEKVFE